VATGISGFGHVAVQNEKLADAMMRTIRWISSRGVLHFFLALTNFQY
jgi:hypothetical protein